MPVDVNKARAIKMSGGFGEWEDEEPEAEEAPKAGTVTSKIGNILRDLSRKRGE